MCPEIAFLQARNLHVAVFEQLLQHLGRERTQALLQAVELFRESCNCSFFSIKSGLRSPRYGTGSVPIAGLVALGHDRHYVRTFTGLLKHVG